MGKYAPAINSLKLHAVQLREMGEYWYQRDPIIYKGVIEALGKAERQCALMAAKLRKEG